MVKNLVKQTGEVLTIPTRMGSCANCESNTKKTVKTSKQGEKRNAKVSKIQTKYQKTKSQKFTFLRVLLSSNFQLNHFYVI